MKAKAQRPPVAEDDVESIANKSQGIKEIIFTKVIDALEKKAINRKVRFSDAYHTLSWLFHLNRRESKSLLEEMEGEGYIRIVPFNFIELKTDFRRGGQ